MGKHVNADAVNDEDEARTATGPDSETHHGSARHSAEPDDGATGDQPDEKRAADK
ncbi:MAG: hypothetical protein ABUT11_01510 [Leifsonia sp.]